MNAMQSLGISLLAMGIVSAILEPDGRYLIAAIMSVGGACMILGAEK